MCVDAYSLREYYLIVECNKQISILFPILRNKMGRSFSPLIFTCIRKEQAYEYLRNSTHSKKKKFLLNCNHAVSKPRSRNTQISERACQQ